MKETETKTKPKKESEQKDSDKPLSNFDKSDKPKSEEPKSVSFPKEFESGGFPSPSQLEEYNSVADGTAARILQMAHTQQTQRHRLQWARLSVRRLQSWLGFFICGGYCLGDCHCDFRREPLGDCADYCRPWDAYCYLSV